MAYLWALSAGIEWIDKIPFDPLKEPLDVALMFLLTCGLTLWTNPELLKGWPSGGEEKNPGFVYVIQDKETGLYKIGRTKDLERRLRELGVGKSARLVKSKRVGDMVAVEKAAHKRYKSSRLPQTEYFKLSSPPEVQE